MKASNPRARVGLNSFTDLKKSRALHCIACMFHPINFLFTNHISKFFNIVLDWVEDLQLNLYTALN